MSVTITISDPQIDKVVVYDLKQSLEQQFDLDTDEGGQFLEPDHELISALKTVLKYYMSCNEVTAFLEEVSMKEAGMHAQLLER